MGDYQNNNSGSYISVSDFNGQVTISGPVQGNNNWDTPGAVGVGTLTVNGGFVSLGVNSTLDGGLISTDGNGSLTTANLFVAGNPGSSGELYLPDSIFDGFSVKAVSIGNRGLYGTSGGLAMSWDDHKIALASGGVLADSGGTSILTESRQLLNEGGSPAINFYSGNHQLLNGSGNVVFDFTNNNIGINNIISPYNGWSSAGNGVAQVMGSASRFAQTASIGSTNFVGSTASGLYTAVVVLQCTTAGTAGTVSATISWTDDAGATSQTIGPLSLTAKGRTNTVFAFRNLTGTPTYSTTVTGATGSPQYAFTATISRTQ
jgi:hypothetical protein